MSETTPILGRAEVTHESPLEGLEERGAKEGQLKAGQKGHIVVQISAEPRPSDGVPHDVHDASVRIGDYSQRLLNHKARLERKSKALDAYTWQEGDSNGTKILKVFKWIFTLGIAPAIAALDASMYKSLLKKYHGNLEIKQMSFQEYFQNPNITTLPQDPIPKIYQDVYRSYATYNGESILEMTWKSLQKTNQEEELRAIIDQYPTFSEAKTHSKSIPSWTKIEEKMKEEFRNVVYPKLMEQLRENESPEAIQGLIGAMCQAGGVAFISPVTYDFMLKNEGTTPPPKIVSGTDSVEFVNENGRKTVTMKAIVGEIAPNGKTFGEKAHKIYVKLDFVARTIDYTIETISNPSQGKPVI